MGSLDLLNLGSRRRRPAAMERRRRLAAMGPGGDDPAAMNWQRRSARARGRSTFPNWWHRQPLQMHRFEQRRSARKFAKSWEPASTASAPTLSCFRGWIARPTRSLSTLRSSRSPAFPARLASRLGGQPLAGWALPPTRSCRCFSDPSSPPQCPGFPGALPMQRVARPPFGKVRERALSIFRGFGPEAAGDTTPSRQSSQPAPARARREGRIGAGRDWP